DMTAAADMAKRPAAAASGARASPSHKRLIALAAETLDGWSLGYQQELQSAWRVKTDDAGALPQCARVARVEGEETLVAKWADDDFEWKIPGATAGAAPQDKGTQTLWSGRDMDGGKVTVIVVNHKTRGAWLAIRKGSRTQVVQMQGFNPNSMSDAKKKMMEWAQSFCSAKMDKPAIEAAKAEWLK
ncbi:unnamed protein product, partial [Prorocentrum cordatum]